MFKFFVLSLTLLGLVAVNADAANVKVNVRRGLFRRQNVVVAINDNHHAANVAQIQVRRRHRNVQNVQFIQVNGHYVPSNVVEIRVR